jgi:NAD(P)-dependent dehydrogenase (short-subunit alcohol dehydrogenase family)/formamidopyrimidine-DNA glycosylase
MPEGDTTHRAAAALRRALVGRELVRVELPRLRPPLPRIGATVQRVEARGKHLLIGSSDGLVVHTHQRMTGSWHLYRPGERWRKSARAARVVLGVDGVTAVCFASPIVEVLDAGALRRHPVLRRLGPDLCEPAADLEEVLRRVEQVPDPATPVGEILLDQRLASGIGNVYRCEVLFLHGRHPTVAIGAVPEPERRALFETAATLLRSNLDTSRRTTVDGAPPGTLWVYDREGAPCRRCGTPIQRGVLGEPARSVFWCGTCQLPPGRSEATSWDAAARGAATGIASVAVPTAGGVVDLALQGARVLVTGGAGGIGAVTCRVLAAEGAEVAVHHRTSERAAAQLAAEVGGIALQADLTDPDAVERLVRDTVAALGGLDAVVANAGVWPAEDLPLWELPIERWRHTVEVDLTGSFLTLRAFLRHIAERRDHPRPPAIVLVGSTAGTFGEAGHADYAAAKAGLQVGLLASLKNEVVALHPRARVNAVAPGWTVTPMTASELDDALVAKVTATVPLRKVAEPEDVAQAVAWLLSDRVAGHVTGQLLTVAGGMEGRLLHPPGS